MCLKPSKSERLLRAAAIREQYDLSVCTSCPRECRADRTNGKLGFCRSDDNPMVASVCTHLGEEPVLSGDHGICNVFFGHCNLQCIYCQNYQISDNRSPSGRSASSLTDVTDRICRILDRGAIAVGFVSPSHCIAQMLQIIESIERRGYHPVTVYNSNGYDRADTIHDLEGLIDVYLPDLKYMDDHLAHRYSQVDDYTTVATAALRQMFCQMGPDIELDENGLTRRGLIIRHLVLPGQVENSKAVLRFIARELSPDVHVSLMSQYYPTPRVKDDECLNRRLRADEYEAVLDEFDRLGLHRGWLQDMSSPDNYQPDFEREDPFSENQK